MRITHHRRFTANHTVRVDWRGRRYFVKVVPRRAEAAAQLAGHRRLREHYRIPRLLAHYTIGRLTVLIFDRHGTDTPDTGLLLDEINTADRTGDTSQLDNYLTSILGTYSYAIDATRARVRQDVTVSKLYGDRAQPGGRLDSYYAADAPILLLPGQEELRPSDLRHTVLVVNRRVHRLDFASILADLRRFFVPSRQVWTALTQGDPTDVNLGTGPVWFDHDTGGPNALAGEFACFLWYQFVQGGWLVPTYNPAAFVDHPATLDLRTRTMPTVQVRRDGRSVIAIDYSYAPSPARRHVMSRYLQELVRPLAAQIEVADVLEWLRPYLVMRILGVYNIGELSPSDAALSLALLAETLSPHTELHSLLGLSQPAPSNPGVSRCHDR